LVATLLVIAAIALVVNTTQAHSKVKVDSEI